MHYFAYGSNMNWAQMQRRCPSSRFVSIGRLIDYRFAITRHSRLRDCGTANVFPFPGETVWGIVYAIDDRELTVLDSFEDGYHRETLPILAANELSAPLDALVYVAAIEVDVPPPNPEYKRLMVEGARHWGLPAVYRKMLEALATSTEIELALPLTAAGGPADLESI